MRTRKLPVGTIWVAIWMVLFTMASSSGAAPWYLRDDFLFASNPAGQWAYGWEASRGSAFNPYEVKIVNAWGNTQWISSTINDPGNDVPTVWKNTSTTRLNGVDPGEAALHPGRDNQYSVVRWTSPLTDTVSVYGSFGVGDFGWTSYHIFHNGDLLLNLAGNQITQPFSYNIGVVPGDTIDFLVGTEGDPYGFAAGNTPLEMTIVPEPRIGLFALLGSRWLLLRISKK